MICSDRPETESAKRPVALVLDTNVCLDLLLFKDPSTADLVQQLHNGSCRAYRSAATSEEWRRVLGYSVWGLSAQRQRELAAAFAASTLEVAVPADADPALPRCRDKDDQKFLQLAATVPVTALISKDRDLLKLAKPCRRRGLFAVLSPAQWSGMTPAAIDVLEAELAQRRRAGLRAGF